MTELKRRIKRLTDLNNAVADNSLIADATVAADREARAQAIIDWGVNISKSMILESTSEEEVLIHLGI